MPVMSGIMRSHRMRSKVLPPLQSAKAWAAAQAAGGRSGLSLLVILPVILLAVFIAIYLYDKSRGGYKKEILVQHQDETAAV